MYHMWQRGKKLRNYVKAENECLCINHKVVCTSTMFVNLTVFNIV